MGSLLCISAALAPWLASCFFAALFVFFVLAIIAMHLEGTQGLRDLAKLVQALVLLIHGRR
jgi:hypothetical protein